MRYQVSGENRQVGAIGRFEGFSIPIDALSPESASDVARQARYDVGFEHVHIRRVELIEDEPEPDYESPAPGVRYRDYPMQGES